MGWSGGSSLLWGVWASAFKKIPKKKDRTTFGQELIKAFEDMDCDTIYEILDGSGKATKELRDIYKELNPGEDYWDEENWT